LKGTRKTFIYTSGASIVGDTGNALVDETYPSDPQNFRSAVEALVLGYARQKMRVVIIRPSFVYGQGGGILPRYITYARTHGIAGYVLPGNNNWPFVHVNDLAELYWLALEAAMSGSIYNAAAGDPIPMVSLSQAIADNTGASLTAWTPEEAISVLGRIAPVLSINLRVSGQRAVQQLGWSPSAFSLVEEIQHLLS
jgi:nucleoside-diphosphate-sugar epimerase